MEGRLDVPTQYSRDYAAMNNPTLLNQVAQFYGITLDALTGEGTKRPVPDARLQAAALLFACGFQEHSVASQLNKGYAWAAMCRQRFFERKKFDKPFAKQAEKLWQLIIDSKLYNPDASRIKKKPHGK